MVVTDAAEVVELVGRIGADLAPNRSGPVVPRDLLSPAASRVLEALPGRGVASEQDIAREAGATVVDTLGRLHELQALGFAERGADGWALVRTGPDGGPPGTH